MLIARAALQSGLGVLLLFAGFLMSQEFPAAPGFGSCHLPSHDQGLHGAAVAYIGVLTEVVTTCGFTPDCDKVQVKS